jgi:hypothetical protein
MGCPSGLDPTRVEAPQHFVSTPPVQAIFCILEWQAHAPKACALRGAMMKRALFWGTILAGAVAAYLMYRRGESMVAIAVRTVTNPVGSLVTELEAAVG